MAEISTGSESTQFMASLQYVKEEVINALDQAASHLDTYSEQGEAEHLRAFLEEVQQIRGTFKMLDFRAGERLCEELAETGRQARNQQSVENTLNVFTQAIVFLKRYLEAVAAHEPVAASLLVPTINVIRQERGDKPLPEAYFFLVNLRPQVNPPTPVSLPNIPYRRARQLYQVGLLALMRGQGRRGPVEIMSRSVRRFEQISRGTPAWLFWYVTVGAIEALAQEAFEMTPQRLLLLRVLDRQVRRIQELEAKAFQEKVPDWLLKEFLYLISIAQPNSQLLKDQQRIFHLANEVPEALLAQTRLKLRGPDQSALDSLSKALQEELQSIKDSIDIFERTEISAQNFDELLISLNKIADTLLIANLTEANVRTRKLIEHLQKNGVAGLSKELLYIADEVIQIEQAMRALTHSGLDRSALVDPVSLKEARIAVISESMGALSMVKRAVGSYLDSNNDKLHVNNVSKSLVDVAGAMMFLEQELAYRMMLELEKFIRKSVIEASTAPSQHKIEAFADAISAIEYFLDTINAQGGGANEALKLAADSIRQL